MDISTYKTYMPPNTEAVPIPDAKFVLLPNEILFAYNQGIRFAPAAAHGVVLITNMRFAWSKALNAGVVLGGGLLAVGIAAGQKDFYEVPLSKVTRVSDQKIMANKFCITITTFDNNIHKFVVNPEMGFWKNKTAEAKAAHEIMMNVLNYCSRENYK